MILQYHPQPTYQLSVDISLRNILFADPSLHDLTDSELIEELGEFEKAPLTLRADDGDPGPGKPREYTETVCWNGWNGEDECDICLIDFDQSFFHPIEAGSLSQPFHLKVPESIFEDSVDFRADLWRAGIVVSRLCAPTPYILMNANAEQVLVTRSIP